MKKVFDDRNMLCAGANKNIQLQGIFEIQKTRQNLMDYLEMLGYDLSEKDLVQCNEAPKREITVFVDGNRYVDDYWAIWISFKLDMSGSDVEVEENGKKVIKSKGNAQLIASIYLEEDPYKKQPKKGIAKFWFNLFFKFHHQKMQTEKILEAAGELGKFINFFKTQVGSKL